MTTTEAALVPSAEEGVPPSATGATNIQADLLTASGDVFPSGKWHCVSGQGEYVRGNDGKWHWVSGQGGYVRGKDGKWHWNRNADVNPRY